MCVVERLLKGYKCVFLRKKCSRVVQRVGLTTSWIVWEKWAKFIK